jgi:hypothetical protein
MGNSPPGIFAALWAKEYGSPHGFDIFDVERHVYANNQER